LSTRCITAAVVDERLQLFNEQLRGSIHDVSVAEAAITSLHGILLDFDPDRLHPNAASRADRDDPKRLWANVVEPWMQRHPVFAKARVVASGRGLHAILRFSSAVDFTSECEREYWAAVVQVVQKLLPTDPDCPGITALTRPLGSVNGKNGETVRLLDAGQPVNPDEVLALCADVVARPFAIVAGLLFSSKRITPCPVCQVDSSRLDILDQVGMCYGGCGKVQIGQLFDLFLQPRPAKKGGK